MTDVPFINTQPNATSPRVNKTKEEWQAELTPEEFRVLREAGTEPAHQGKYTNTDTPGRYLCKACGAELFDSDAKFNASCGWPAFYRPVSADSITYLDDTSIPGMPRVEVRCTNCGSHLGHVFSGEGYETPTDLRYCINSICLKLDANPSN